MLRCRTNLKETRIFAKSILTAAALVVALPLASHGRAETAPRLERVAEIVSVKIERLKEGDNSHRITAVGRVPTEGWTNARLRAIRERHPNNAVAGFEMVATPPKKGTAAAKTASELTATLETVIGAVQHTIVVRGRKNAVDEVNPPPN